MVTVGPLDLLLLFFLFLVVQTNYAESELLFLFPFSDKPKIAIALGRSINAHQIKQGDDVYFECKVLAYPQVRTVHWLKDVSSTPACSSMIKTTLYCIR